MSLEVLQQALEAYIWQVNYSSRQVADTAGIKYVLFVIFGVRRQVLAPTC